MRRRSSQPSRQVGSTTAQPSTTRALAHKHASTLQSPGTTTLFPPPGRRTCCRELSAILTIAAVFAALLVVGCESPTSPVVCVDIPSGGCPQDNGADVCQDWNCKAVYDCVNGGWVFNESCPSHPYDASTDAHDGSEAGADTSARPIDAQIDVPPGANGGKGCADLEVPDCSLATGLACTDATDCCGCQDLWICQNGGWVLWGECTDAGAVQSRP